MTQFKFDEIACQVDHYTLSVMQEWVCKELTQFIPGMDHSPDPDWFFSLDIKKYCPECGEDLS